MTRDEFKIFVDRGAKAQRGVDAAILAGYTKVSGGNSYEIWHNPAGYPAIRCLKCKIISHNSEDVAHRYCGFCHRFHEEGL